MEDYIKDAVNASGDEILLEAYDKEWALTDLGKQEGFKEGFEEAKTEIVCNMLRKNMDVNLISEITGLSTDEINNIKLNNI